MGDDGDQSDDLSFKPGAWRSATPDGNPLFAPRGLPVQESDDLERILNLPRRPPVVAGSATSEALIEIAMQKYGRGPRQCRCEEIDEQVKIGRRKCITRLNWAQSWILHEISVADGALASASVGIGKTLCNLLGPLALKDCHLALLLIPPTLRKQIIREYELLREHFRVPGLVVHLSKNETVKFLDECETGVVLHVLPYSRLSSPESSTWIENLAPDAIIADEVDALSSLISSRTMRVMRYYASHWQTTRFCGWTGSLTDNSISEFAHLSALALRDNSPLPHDPMVVDEWGRCLDATPNPCPPGALIRLLGPGEGIHDVRKAFSRRLAETPGFILISGKQSIKTSSGTEVQLHIRERPAPTIPPIIEKALNMVRNDGVRPDTLAGNADDEIITDPLEQSKCARQIASGFFYRWVFPLVNGQPQSRELIRDWYAARKAWNSELRHKVLRGEVQLDSAKLCEDAARRAYGELPEDDTLPSWKADNWPVWRDIRDKVVYDTEAVRLHPFLVDDAARWAVENRGIVWYEMIEFAEWLEERGRDLFGINIPIHGGGLGAEERIMKERGDRSIAASVSSHGRGRDRLQYLFHNQLLAQMIASARRWQQLLGRMKRNGQESEDVYADIYLHTEEVVKAYQQALNRGSYVNEITLEDQLLTGIAGR